MATIVIDLDHVEKGIKQLEKLLIEDFNKAVDDGLREIAEKTSLHMTKECNSYGLSEREFMKTQKVDLVGNTVEVGYDADYYPFIEYGTGIRGKEEPHPESFGWQYDTNHLGENGGGFKSKNGGFYRTRGTRSRPIVYNTEKWARTQTTRIMRKHLRSML